MLQTWRVLRTWRGAGNHAQILVFDQKFIIFITLKMSFVFTVKNSDYVMFSYSQKRKITKTNSTLEEKAWLIDHAEKNDKLSMSRLALDFSSKFNRTINKSTVSRILSSKKQACQTGSIVQESGF